MLKQDFAKLAVLIADPAPNMSAVVVSMLRTLRFGKVETVTNSNSALVQLQSRKFGVILIDDDLGPLDGVAFTRTLRAFDRAVNRDTPVIMMSAAPSLERIKDARDAGINEFLRRPFAVEHLRSRIIAVLQAPRPFITAPAYVGPDRRRRHLDFDGEERRAAAAAARAEAEALKPPA